MTDIRVRPDIPRIRRTIDLVSGEELVIAYKRKTDEVTINGYSVIRCPGLTGQAGETVFHEALGVKKFTVATASLAELYI